MDENTFLGGDAPLLLIAGPCVIENLENLRETAGTLKEIARGLGVGLVFKSSFDKANRSSLDSYRGPGAEAGLGLLKKIKEEFRIPVLSDVHDVGQVEKAKEVLDFIQIPAFLSRQTDLLTAAARTGKPANVKKGQFMAPGDMRGALEKLSSQPGFAGLSLCERGACFGYNNLVVDMRSLVIMRSFGWPVIFDATHSVQLPAAAGGKSGGERKYVPALAKAATAVGIDGIFLETHPDPDKALCDGPNQWPLSELEGLLKTLLAVRKAVKDAERPGE
ncbi:MAG: 3-deoxy-8-phosphooctulonate synthase [Deltaproteobacteria bacterium]|nr:3-deoxy-8-phosphooctulonate synthase [Deltaproteobacteria bacterium]